MQAIMDLKRARKARLLEHEFFRWVRSDAVPIERRLLFAPIMTNFVMAFRDANKWFIRFPTARSRFEEVINGCTLEDETHSRLFLEEWRRLGLDEKLGWRASDTLYWIYLAPETEPFRRYVLEMASLSVRDGGDPLIRFAHSEAGEACGNAFFAVLAPIAEQVDEKTGLVHRYFGPHHLDKEPGHVLESPGVFEHVTLAPEQRALALALANKMFDCFEGIHDCFLEYARSYVEKNRFPKRPSSKPRDPSPEPHKEAPSSALPAHPSHAAVFDVLQMRKARAERHPLYTWLREEPSVSPKQKLMRLIPMWIVDILGYRELNVYAIRYPEARSSGAMIVNGVCDDLETHNTLFLADWDALGMDAALGWNASDTLAFCFLDPKVDVHRKNLATFVKLAIRNERPALRFWLVEALEASGHAFFANTRRLALEVEREEGIVLDYLADRHELAHAKREGHAAGRARITSEPLDDEGRDAAIGIVHAVFDALEEQLGISLEAVRENRILAQSGAQ